MRVIYLKIRYISTSILTIVKRIRYFFRLITAGRLDKILNYRSMQLLADILSEFCRTSENFETYLAVLFKGERADEQGGGKYNRADIRNGLDSSTGDRS